MNLISSVILTANGLFELHKQIVLVSDRKPSDMVTLEDRLKGRFGAGILMQIHVPDYPTRVQITRAKAVTLGLKLDEETVNYIATTLPDNVRQIEGALRKIRAFYDLSGMELNLPNISKTLEDLKTTEQSTIVTPELINRCVCRYYGIEDTQLKSQLRSKNISEPRQIAMYLIRHITKMSLPEIGKIFGCDHGTVHHAVKKVESSLHSSDSRLENIINDIKLTIEEAS